MSKIYKSRRRAEPAHVQGKEPAQASAPMIGNQSVEALMTGAQAPSAENLGHQVDLPGAVREKMENAFGADLGGVRLYESQAVADAGAQAITMGNKIGFAPGQLDLASSGGQSLLGHEMSHVVSQARGEVAGNGFLNDHALEARADREGAMAAAGESVYSGPVAPLSASSVDSAAGPMQAKKPWKKDKAPAEPAPAPAPEPEETYTPQQQALGRSAMQQERDEISEGRAAYDAARARYDATSQKGPYRFDGGQEAHYDRYLKRHLRGKSDEEQDKIFRAFAERDHKAMAPYLADDIRSFNSLNYSALDSDSDDEVAQAYGQFAGKNMDLMSVSDFIKERPEGKPALFSAKDLGLEEEELEKYKEKKFDFSTAVGEARESTKRMFGEGGAMGESTSELRMRREIRKLDRAHQEGKMDDGTYRMMITPYQRYRRKG